MEGSAHEVRHAHGASVLVPCSRKVKKTEREIEREREREVNREREFSAMSVGSVTAICVE